MKHESVLILDFGSQYTQLIARRIREARVYSEILPYDAPWEEIEGRSPRALILSGGPSSVFAADAPHPDPRVYDFSGPILGICYGMQLLAHHYGGRVQPARAREYGKSHVRSLGGSTLFAGLPETLQVWMSHGDQIEGIPDGFTLLARSDNAPAAMEDARRERWGLQFHPEVAHTPQGREILENFLYSICGLRGDWTASSFIQEAVEKVRLQVGSGSAVCGLSGGIDSTVAAMLVHRAIGDRLACIFVDNGLLRKNEFEQVLAVARDQLHLNVRGVEARQRFLRRLSGVADPERKRKIIGEEFIRVFEEEAGKLGRIDFLVQGTLYPDVIESVSVKGPSAVIKSHHNVGGLPEKMQLRLVEPLRELFKDEVRRVGRELGLSDRFIHRQPFPGPGLAVRIIGEITEERLETLREADAVLQDEIRAAGLYEKIWQSFAVLLPIKTVGVMGDDRTYENVVAVRAVHSQDGMTADWVPLSYDLLGRISVRIVNEVRGVNRVVYDISSKPPGTIEWE
ncbi:MAG TPA: glutamine-hydrolyzing GMP synthase [Acidobacteriota bacterium]|nr:glutamine-hydrolyzing GMP synthase [Acidobacteriota bacterium]